MWQAFHLMDELTAAENVDIAVTMTGIVAVLTFRATAGQKAFGGSDGLGNPVHSRDEQMLAVLTVVLVALAVLNAIVTAWATVLDARHSSALARALGATPQQVSAGCPRRRCCLRCPAPSSASRWASRCSRPRTARGHGC
ncbi:MAG: hypothetical protein ABR926_23905 [Streptosporangiaceae bacterium]|jgi:hypothetical protein